MTLWLNCDHAPSVDGTPVAIIRRFDRTAEGARIAYLSGGSLLQARRDEDRAYTELADALRRVSATPSQDVRELWRRLLHMFAPAFQQREWDAVFRPCGTQRL
jgi:hypothetical protein